MSEYGHRAEARAYALGNRGPIRVGADGKASAGILDRTGRTLLRVLQGVTAPEELAELRADLDAVLSRAPVAPDATVDHHGRPAPFEGILKPPYKWAGHWRSGRAPTQQRPSSPPCLQPRPDKDAPAWTVELLDGNLHLSDAACASTAIRVARRGRRRSSADDFVPTTRSPS